MTIDELVALDNTFNEAMFLTKVNNVFVKLFTAIMMDKLSEVDHFIGDDVYAYGEAILRPIRGTGKRQMYDELNVKTSRIRNIEVVDNNFVITVDVESRYMDYVLDLNTGDVVSGNDSRRIEVPYVLTFTKQMSASAQGVARKCPACGAPMNVNKTGKCEYCGCIYNQEDYDWVLTKLVEK